MNKRTKQILAATATLLILVILQSISLPTETRSVAAWHPTTSHGKNVDGAAYVFRDRDRHDLEDLRARPTR